MEELFLQMNESFNEAREGDYNDADAVLMVECIMTENLDTNWLLRCITALGMNLGLDEELYEVQIEEDGEDGQLPFGEETYQTSEFVEWIAEATRILLVQGTAEEFAQFYFDSAIEFEKYEILSKLEMEQRWGVKMNKKKFPKFV